MYRVLLLDDEPFILNALRRCLTSIDAGQLNGEALRAEAFTSSDAALERWGLASGNAFRLRAARAKLLGPEFDFARRE